MNLVKYLVLSTTMIIAAILASYVPHGNGALGALMGLIIASTIITTENIVKKELNGGVPK